MQNVSTIRLQLANKLINKDFVIDKTGAKTIEIVGASFIADEPKLFGKVNDEWNLRELTWYKSKSLYVDDIPHPVPSVWQSVSSRHGRINSNYGWAIYSEENGNQYDNVLAELRKNPDSRRGQMIYTRPSMHKDWNRDGMSDFMCCSNTVHFIRNGSLETCVYYRSNDGIFGYKGDFFFKNHVHQSLASDLGVKAGNIIWNAASLHVYERHFGFVQDWIDIANKE